MADTVKMVNLGCGNRYHAAWINLDFNSNAPEVRDYDLHKTLPFEDNSINVIYHSHLLEHFSKHDAEIFLQDCYRVLSPGGILRIAVPDLEQIAKLYLSLLERAAQGDQDAAVRYEWIMLEMFDQAVRNVSGGEMLNYWKQDPMPAEKFVIERVGDEVKTVLREIRSSPAHADSQPRQSPSPIAAEDIGRFRQSGEIHQWMYDRYSLSRILKLTGFVSIKQCAANESDIKDFNSYLLDINTDGLIRKPDSLFIEARKPDKA